MLFRKTRKMLTVSVFTIGAFVFGGALSVGAESSYEGYSTVDYLNYQDKDSSFQNRKELAEDNGIYNYTGTAEQNLTLLSDLRNGNVDVNVPESTDSTSNTSKKNTEASHSSVGNNETNSITMEATAYTATCEGCSGTTYTGINLKANPDRKVIAVDPNTIPLGTKVHVEGYGTAVAGDIGGDINGNRIDVFIPTQSEALSFGRRNVEVTILD